MGDWCAQRSCCQAESDSRGGPSFRGRRLGGAAGVASERRARCLSSSSSPATQAAGSARTHFCACVAPGPRAECAQPLGAIARCPSEPQPLLSRSADLSLPALRPGPLALPCMPHQGTLHSVCGHSRTPQCGCGRRGDDITVARSLRTAFARQCVHADIPQCRLEHQL